jgi:HSP20 family molecular chaperone IbpA
MMAKIEKSVEINVPVHTAYNQLTQFTEFPRFMQGVQEIRQLDDTHLHWHSKSDGQDKEWDSEITQQIPDQCIAWRNITGPKNAGKIVLQPIAQDKTKVTLSMEFEPEPSSPDAANAEANIAQRIEQDLARFKKLIETQGQESGEWRGEVRDAQVVKPDDSQQAATAAQAGQQAPNQQANQPSGQQQAQPRSATQADARKSEAEPWLPRLMDVWEEPLVVMRRMSQEMDNLFDRFIGRPLGIPVLMQSGSRNWTPPVEVTRRNNQLVVCADLPGIKREDVHVEIKNDKLTIEGDRRMQGEQSQEQEYRRTERPYGHFYRMVPLPEDVDPDSATASMHDGVLEITLPVMPSGRQGRRLDIQSPR